MKKVLILHAWCATPNDHWYQWLEKELKKKNYKVIIPELKDKDNPTLDDWESCALKDFTIDKSTIMLGHSLGAVLALKIIQDNNFKLDKLVTIAGWDFWDLTPEHESFFREPIDHNDIKIKTKERYVIHSDTDPYITAWQASEYAKRLDAGFKLVKGKGHFTDKDGVKRVTEIAKLLG